ncbi:MAG: hypothetical protein LBE38_12055 [Deltaproteobacteria bacterium]|jgi:hypothetical protein|nr:hypothetical protein [Deltaproteobacteria bacterium]
MYIAYDRKKGLLYAKLYTSKRIGTKTFKEYINLGLVLDKEKGIYKNRERGIFTYNLADNSYGKPPDSFIPVLGKPIKEKQILDFGDSFLLNKFICDSGLHNAIQGVFDPRRDTLLSLIFYYILCPSSNNHAKIWWEGSYAKLLYPKANLSNHKINEFLTSLGDDSVQRGFFERYFPMIMEKEAGQSVLFDLSGLPKSVHFPATAISSNNGELHDEVRLILVSNPNTCQPICFRHFPYREQIVTTLAGTIKDLKLKGIDIDLSILDRDYYSEDDIRELHKAKIPFVTKLSETHKLFDELVSIHANSLEQKENLVYYNGQYIYIKRIPCQFVEGFAAYAFIGLDIERKTNESKKLIKQAAEEFVPTNEFYQKISRQGIFILISSKPLQAMEILSTYHAKDCSAQVFEIEKPLENKLPTKIRSEETLRGHLFLTFITTVIIKELEKKLIGTPYSPTSLFMNLKNQKCKVLTDRILIQKAVLDVKDIYKIFAIDCPMEIPHQNTIVPPLDNKTTD